jgi:hypothetical protein
MSHIKYSYEFETETSKTPSYLRPQKPEVKWLGGEPFLSEQLDDDEIHRLNYCADHKSQLIRRLYHIQDVLLKEVDPQLYAHFTEIKFTPADYGYGMYVY